MVAALARQLVDDPGFRFPLHQQPAAGKERRRPVKANMKRDAPPVFRIQTARPKPESGDAGGFTHQATDVFYRRQR